MTTEKVLQLNTVIKKKKEKENTGGKEAWTS